MTFSFKKKAIIAFTSLLFCTQVLADSDHHNGVGMKLNGNGLKPVNANSHAPIGVMGDHMHKKGEWMLSYRYQYMEMEGNRIGETEVSPAFITANIANRFGTPPRLLVVPTKMTMDMHMFGAMYAPTDWLTLMAMGMYMEKSMDHITFNAVGGTLGTFNAKSKGIGDTKFSGMIRLYDNKMHHIHLNAGLSLPTGSVTKSDDALTPAGGGTIANLRLPYAMQLGSGTFDILPGVTYTGKMNSFSWGAQYMGTFRTGDNNGYTWGDKQEVTSWVSYQWRPWISTSTRIAYSHEEQINGTDSLITAPVQTADPDNYGGDIVNLMFGVNLAGQTGRIRGHRLAAEIGIPLHRDLNGPQLETDLTVTAGWQYAF
jgi:hypothetical protein